MYSPKIREDQIRYLYRLKEETGVPMTYLVQEAVDQFRDWSAERKPEDLKDYLKNERNRSL